MARRLADQVAELAERVARLEHAQQAAPEIGSVLQGLGDDPGDGTVTYRGSGPWGDSSVAWILTRRWPELTTAPLESPARVLAALAHPSRLRIVTELVGGETTTAELVARLGFTTTGQLFHHLKELLAVGVVHQPRRGAYALRPQHVVALLAVISAAIDLSPPAEGAPTEGTPT